MATKRSELIDSANAGFYHLISRCVRRTFLCGIDPDSGQSYEHRRGWIESRILSLANLFSIEVYGYAVMHNHYHLVAYSDPLAPQQWSDEVVAEKWLTLYPGKLNDPARAQQRAAKKAAIMADEVRLATYRERLGSLSWLMRCINEPIAKQSNAEDFCKGHFWESRFKSQALLDEAAAITCMAYIDLNPIRAGIAKTPEESTHTSIQHRLIHMTNEQLNEAVTSIAGKVREKPLTIKLNDYIELVDWTGKQIIHPGKGVIPAHLAPIFERLNLKQDQWLNQVKAYGSHYYRAVGQFEQLMAKAKSLNQHWFKGIRAAKAFYSNPK